MRVGKVIAMRGMALSVFVAFHLGSYATQQQSPASGKQQNIPVQVSITTGGGLFGPPKDRYQVGQRIPVSISMMNNSDQPIEVCDSDTIYQDRPKLLKDGQPVPYLIGQRRLLRTVEKDRTCSKFDVLDPVILKPGESRVVDWFILAEGSDPLGDMTWYEPLVPGKYELSIERRLQCCDGAMLQSNKVNFEAVP